MDTALEILFWLAGALIVWTQLGYPLALGVLAAAGHAKTPVEPRAQDRLPAISLIVAAHDEQT